MVWQFEDEVSGNEDGHRTEEGEGLWKLIVVDRLGNLSIDRESDNGGIWCLA